MDTSGRPLGLAVPRRSTSRKALTLEDRLAFLEGKKAELMSIFENGVWEIELDPQSVDHRKGGLKAKARLVLQKFSDRMLLPHFSKVILKNESCGRASQKRL